MCHARALSNSILFIFFHGDGGHAATQAVTRGRTTRRRSAARMLSVLRIAPRLVPHGPPPPPPYRSLSTPYSRAHASAVACNRPCSTRDVLPMAPLTEAFGINTNASGLAWLASGYIHQGILQRFEGCPNLLRGFLRIPYMPQPRPRCPPG